MNPVPEILPISELRQQQDKVLTKLAEGPVVLTQHGRAAVVMLSPQEWNQIVEELEDLQDALDAIEARRVSEPSMNFEEYLAKRGEGV